MHLTHRDVWLSNFAKNQHAISKLTSGDALTVNCDGGLDLNGQTVLKFSRKFMEEQMEDMQEKGYELKHAKVNFIVYWENKDKKEIKIILPELYFKRKDQA